MPSSPARFYLAACGRVTSARTLGVGRPRVSFVPLAVLTILHRWRYSSALQTAAFPGGDLESTMGDGDTDDKEPAAYRVYCNSLILSNILHRVEKKHQVGCLLLCKAGFEVAAQALYRQVKDGILEGVLGKRCGFVRIP